jgi:hypothetical protein
MASKTMTMEAPAGQAAKYAAAIEAYIAKIDRALERIDQTHAAIEKKKAETRLIRERFKAAR